MKLDQTAESAADVVGGAYNLDAPDTGQGPGQTLSVETDAANN
jgi:hypothetical protein